MSLRGLVLGTAAVFGLAPAAFGQAPTDAPAAETLTEARAIVQGMIADPRGPYSRIRWFCNDGSTQPPTPYACQEHGGGRQHGEYSAARTRLAELGWSVGTVFAALGWDELFDAGHRQQRLRELALERYMQDIDDGWVLRRARDYRGAIQIEAEQAAGRALLLELLADRDFVAANFLLARESVRVIPHAGAGEDRTRDIRRIAVELAERDATFEPIRAEIHGALSARTASRVRAWAERQALDVRSVADELAANLDTLFGPGGRQARLAAQRSALGARRSTAAIAAALPIDGHMQPAERLAALASVLLALREQILVRETSAATRLALFDLFGDLEAEVAVTATEALAQPSASRAELLALARSLVDATYGGGLLTHGERAALDGSWRRLAGRDDIAIEDYAAAIDELRRLPQWAVGSVRYGFAEPLARYTALDSRAAAFVDDLLRGSPLVALSNVSRRLARDLASLTGVTQSLNGLTGVAAFGLNPGVAKGKLLVFPTVEALEHGHYGRDDIVLLPETVAELGPVAGIVTLGEGSPLSHVQLLARNFGIPNVVITPALLDTLAPLEGKEVLVAVASDGSLVLEPIDVVAPAVREWLAPANTPRGELTVPTPDLAVRRPLPLAELRASLSGHVVGPKAANLGELAHLFPGRVAPALAVPFGIFAAHMSAGEESLRERLVKAYAASRSGALDEAGLAAELAGIRDGIAALTLDADTREALSAAMAEQFGPPGSYGLFVRSDTNVEDLPQFTGAGLSETLPNVVGLDDELTAISRVWASVLSPRAVAWRSSLLTNPEEVYASVLLMKSVPSTKSGVMVTTDVTTRGQGLTVSAAWGVGGAVAGEATETLVLRGDETLLVSEAKAAYQRELKPSGGLGWRPAADGAVLAARERDALRALAAEVGEKYVPALDEQGRPRPWDIEFGFVDGELTLFQIRPLVERGPQLADRVVRALVPAPAARGATRVSLNAAPDTATAGGDRS